MSRLLPYLWYPLFFVAGVWAFFAMLAAGAPLALSTYAPILTVAVAIVGLEIFLPERRDWRPRRADIAADAAFMAFAQILIPQLLALGAVLLLAEWRQAYAPSALWPHEWPLLAQILAMVVAVDFSRYWVHRACHTWTPLWRLHEVHHSPDILYTLNVGRFHPLEKVLHFSCDSLPFLLLGVAPEAIAGYFVFYAINGFFQHSNVRLRYGWLNYIVGSAETHRWHHARDPRKAYCNFGNTTIVWDVIFRTWYLPGPIDDIGIMDRRYPKGFLAQMLTPFRGAARGAADLLIPVGLRAKSLLDAWRISRATRDPMRAQTALLMRMMRTNSGTTFGRKHDFSSIRSYEDYARAVPIMEFEALRPYIESEIERGESALTREPPLQYMRTSGSTGKPKDIPLTASHLVALRLIQRRSVAFQFRASPKAFAGSIIAIVSPAEEGRLANGKPFGAASGIVAAGTSALVREKFVLPEAVLAISDARIKYLAILRLAVADWDVTYFGSANSTTPLALIKLYREHEEQLIEDIGSGGFFLLDQVPEPARTELNRRLRTDRMRAQALDRLRARGTATRIADLWPRLAMVVTWTCGSAGVTVKALREELAPATRILELGYVSSEFRGTLTLGGHSGTGLPTFDTHFYEFAERDKWDRGEREVVALDGVRKGVDYYIIVTTPSGLYRYFINDVVRVTGRYHATPLLKFMQKGKGVTNITGEKLYESQVLAAVAEAMETLKLKARFVMMLADEEARGYRLYVEPDRVPAAHAEQLAAEVDVRLRRLNIEYDGKRDSNRLAAPGAVWLRPETGEAYKRYCVGQGQREGQFKCVAIAYRKSFSFDLDAHGA
jgi:sterol desaturase/sphingolipid hydroxylase (fatty acid hydroxylase superfamily)